MPLTTTGAPPGDPGGLFVMPTPAAVRLATLPVPSTFSYRLFPVLAASKCAIAQSVRTVNVAVASIPDVRPRAFTVWSPGVALFGTLNVVENAPLASVVVEATILMASKSIAIPSDTPKDDPDTVTFVVGGPDF